MKRVSAKPKSQTFSDLSLTRLSTSNPQSATSILSARKQNDYLLSSMSTVPSLTMVASHINNLSSYRSIQKMKSAEYESAMDSTPRDLFHTSNLYSFAKTSSEMKFLKSPYHSVNESKGHKSSSGGKAHSVCLKKLSTQTTLLLEESQYSLENLLNSHRPIIKNVEQTSNLFSTHKKKESSKATSKATSKGNSSPKKPSLISKSKSIKSPKAPKVQKDLDFTSAVAAVEIRQHDALLREAFAKQILKRKGSATCTNSKALDRKKSLHNTPKHNTPKHSYTNYYSPAATPKASSNAVTPKSTVNFDFKDFMSSSSRDNSPKKAVCGEASPKKVNAPRINLKNRPILKEKPKTAQTLEVSSPKSVLKKTAKTTFKRPELASVKEREVRIDFDSSPSNGSPKHANVLKLEAADVSFIKKLCTDIDLRYDFAGDTIWEEQRTENEESIQQSNLNASIEFGLERVDTQMQSVVEFDVQEANKNVLLF